MHFFVSSYPRFAISEVAKYTLFHRKDKRPLTLKDNRKKPNMILLYEKSNSAFIFERENRRTLSHNQ